MNLTPEFINAIRRHRQLVEILGMDHPDTMRAMLQAIELAPGELVDEMTDVALEMGVMPEAHGYLDDGSPMYQLEDIAAQLGVPMAKAEEAMHKMLAEREALGLSNVGVLRDSAPIHRKQ